MQVLDYIIRFNMSFQVNNMFILKNAENLCAVPKGGIVLYAGIRLHNKIQHLFSGNNMFILKNMWAYFKYVILIPRSIVKLSSTLWI